MHIKHNYTKKVSKRPKKQVFGHFIKFGCFGTSDIANSDRGKWPLAIDSNQGCGNPLNLCIIITIKHKRAKNETFGHCYQVKLASSCTISLNIMEPMLQRFVRRLVKRFDGWKVWRFEHLEVTKVEICALRHVAVLSFSWARTWESHPSVRYPKSGTSRHRILPKLGMMLKDNECSRVTGPDFLGKIIFINYSWKWFLAIFWRLGPQMDLILHILIVLTGLHDLLFESLVFCIIKGH